MSHSIEHFEVANQEQSLCLCGLLLKVEIQGGVIIISPVYKTGLQLEICLTHLL